MCYKILYATCLESGQYAHICRSFMYYITFESLFLTSKCTQSDFLWTQTVAPHRGFCMAAQKRYRFCSACSDFTSQTAPNRELFTNHLMQYGIQYSTIKSDIYGTHGTMKRPIPPDWSVDYSGPLHLAVATFIFNIERYVKFNNK